MQPEKIGELVAAAVRAEVTELRSQLLRR